jgi:ElaB/YqjD/DUF883 family membrane-anchored ribosome-binding protein
MACRRLLKVGPTVRPSTLAKEAIMAGKKNGTASAIADKVEETAKEQTHQVKEHAQQVVHQGQEAMSRVWDAGRHQFRAALNAQKDRAAGGIGDVADLVKQAGSQLREQGSAGGGLIAENIAGRISAFSESVHEKEIEEIIADTEKFGRSNPVAFLSIAALIGFVLVRFLKSSGETTSAA